MPTVQEIREFTKRKRGETGRLRIDFFGQEKAGVAGACMQVAEVVDQFNGQEWRSNKAKGTTGQVFSGHSLGVIPTRGKAGVVVDFTAKEGPIVGQVKNIKDEAGVRRSLETLSGENDWKKQERLTAREMRERYGL